MTVAGTVRRYFVEFLLPGLIIGETRTEDAGIEKPDPAGVRFPEDAYAFRIWSRVEVPNGDDVLKGKRQNEGPLYYHPGSTVTTLEQLEAPDCGYNVGRILLSNMRNNGWPAVIWTRWKNWPQPYDPAKQVILDRAREALAAARVWGRE